MNDLVLWAWDSDTSLNLSANTAGLELRKKIVSWKN